MIKITVFGRCFYVLFLGLQKSLPLPIGAVWGTCLAAFVLCFLLSLGGWKELYLSAFFFLTSCAAFGAYLSTEGGGEAAIVTAFMFAAFFGVTYPCLYGVILIKRHYAEKRLRQKEQAEKELYVLPERRNEFLRDRLQTGLCKREEELIKTEEAFEWSYVQKTIEKLQAAPLSPADRVTVEKLAEEVAEGRVQTQMSKAQLHLVNESFASILKLAAKYVV